MYRDLREQIVVHIQLHYVPFFRQESWTRRLAIAHKYASPDSAICDKELSRRFNRACLV